MNKKLFSFITTTFNTDFHFLNELFNSFDDLINDERIEFIVIDDCSTNREPFLKLKKIYEKNKNFKFEGLKENTRRTGAFTRGIEISSGRYLMSLDSDDLVFSGSFKNFLLLLENMDQKDFIVNSWYEKKYIDNIIYKNTIYYGKKNSQFKIQNRNSISRPAVFAAFNSIVSGSLARELKYNENKNIQAPHDDAYFCQKWISNSNPKNVWYLDEPFFIYNVEQPWTTFSGSKSIYKNIKTHWKLVKEIISLYDKKNELTIINICSILSTHFKGIAYSNKRALFAFWLSVKFVTPLSLRRSRIYKNSSFKKINGSGLYIFYKEK